MYSIDEIKALPVGTKLAVFWEHDTKGYKLKRWVIKRKPFSDQSGVFYKPSDGHELILVYDLYGEHWIALPEMDAMLWDLL